jgi:hypothetical protein
MNTACMHRKSAVVLLLSLIFRASVGFLSARQSGAISDPGSSGPDLEETGDSRSSHSLFTLRGTDSPSEVRRLLHQDQNEGEDAVADVTDDARKGSKGLAAFVKGSSRPDPLNGFRQYKAGFDPESKDYWASAAFTGIWGYAIGAAWLCIGLVLLLYALIAACCRKLRPRSAAWKKGWSGALRAEKPVVTRGRCFVLGALVIISLVGITLALVGTVQVVDEVEEAAAIAEKSANDAVQVRVLFCEVCCSPLIRNVHGAQLRKWYAVWWAVPCRSGRNRHCTILNEADMHS